MILNTIALPPSVLNALPKPGLSSRYRFIDTLPLVQLAINRNFTLVSAQAMRTRKVGYATSAKHLLRFRATDATPINGVYPELALINSHDGSSTLKLMAGLLRLVCSNGLIVADAAFAPPLVVRHTMSSTDILGQMRHTIEAAGAAAARIPHYSQTLLTPAEQTRFAEQAAILATPEGHALRSNPNVLLHIRRWDDASNNLWSVFNRVQENLVRGGIALPTRTNLNRRQTLHPVRAIDRTVSINTALWTLMHDTYATR